MAYDLDALERLWREREDRWSSPYRILDAFPEMLADLRALRAVADAGQAVVAAAMHCGDEYPALAEAITRLGIVLYDALDAARKP